MVHAIPGGNQRAVKLQALLDKYCAGLKPSKACPPPETGPGHDMHIVLTGSTGSLGSHLLHHLIVAPGVTKIYCLNRATDGERKQVQSNAERGLRDQWNSEQVKFLHADMSKSMFGLEESTYKTLLGDITHFIHFQWPVDFVSDVEAFEGHLQAVRNIIDFSVESSKRPSIIFASSIAIASYWSKRHPDTQVPEAPVHDLALAEMGYGESKLIAELLLDKAAHVCGTHSTVLRIGHIGGPIEKDGFWNKGEWIPTTIVTSRELGVIPHTLAYLNNVDWIPVDVLSDITIELIHSETGPEHRAEVKNGSCLIYNCVNPQDSTWTSLVPTINQHLHGGQLREVSFAEWVETLIEAGDKGQNADKLPALKLLDFYDLCLGAAEPGHEIAKFAHDRGIASSETMRNLKAISQKDMSRWMDQWDF